MTKDRKSLINVADGPEGIHIYTSEDEAVVDWATDFPAMYIEVSLHDCYVKLGPFCMKSLREQIEKIVNGEKI